MFHFSKSDGWAVCLKSVLFCIVCFSISPAFSQPPENTSAASSENRLTAAEVSKKNEQLFEAIKADSETDEATLATAKNAKESTEKALSQWKSAWDGTTKIQKQIEALPTDVQKLKSQIEKLQKQPASNWKTGAKTVELERELTALETTGQALQEAVMKWSGETASQNDRRQKIKQQLQTILEQEESLQLETKEVQKTEVAELAQLLRLNIQTRSTLLNQERKQLQAENRLYEVQNSVGWGRHQLDLAELKLTLNGQQQVALAAHIQKTRQREAAKQVEAAEKNEQVLLAYPEVYAVLEKNRTWAKENQTLTLDLTLSENDLTQSTQLLRELEEQFIRITALVEEVGHTGAIGTLLRKQKTELPDLTDRAALLKSRKEKIAAAQLSLFEVKKERSLVLKNDGTIETFLKNADEKTLQAAKREIEKQNELLNSLTHNYERHYQILLKLNETDGLLIKKTNEFSNYIDERVLWIRSSTLLTAKSLAEDDDSFRWIFRLTGWEQVWTHSLDRIRQAPWQAVGSIFAWSVLLLLGTRWRRELSNLSKTVSPAAYYRFAPTLKATLFTVLISIVWPLLFWGWAWQLAQQSDQSGFPKTLIPTLIHLGNWLFTIEFARQICRPRGLGESHFQWNLSSLLIVRRHLRWLMMVSLPLVFLGGLLEGHQASHGNDAWERVVYVLLLSSVASFVLCIFRPTTGLFQTIIGYKQNAWLDRLRWPCCLFFVALPLLLIVMSLSGYHYSSLHLGQMLKKSVWLMLDLFLIRALLVRWIMLSYRRLNIMRSQQKREQKEALESQGKEKKEVSTEEAPIVIEEEEPVDLRFSSHQIRRLLSATLWTVAVCGLWVIWIDVFPALMLFDHSDKFTLWHSTVQVSAEEGVASIEKLEPITIFDLALGIAIAILTVAATRNIPGLLEMTVLEQLPIDASVRYAVTTLARYTCILVGGFIAFKVIGLNWSQIQWMATALTFGLAFGLQEIFANFISGIILLFERPIRVGDVVTIDDVTGVVSRIRMRATTITNWDRKEYVVPNREFITGRLLNWTLTDSINRIVIEVGIAYGSDVEAASKMIYEIAQQHPEVLEDPCPTVAFDAFGNSTLNILLRAYLPDMNNRVLVRHQLHVQINEAFEKAGIEIAFPQQDVHIRSLPVAGMSDGLQLSSGEGNDQNVETQPEEEQPKSKDE